jgi:hypothetical protein
MEAPVGGIMSKRLIILLVVVPVLAIAIATAVILKSVSTPPDSTAQIAPVTANQSDIPRPMPIAGNAPAATVPSTTQTLATIKPMTAADFDAVELAKLRANNKFLRNEIAALRAVNKRLQESQNTSAQKQSVSSPAMQPQPTIDGFNTFARKFVPLQQESEQRAISMAFPGETYKVICKMIGADLKKTDSLTNPIVGVVVIDETGTVTSTDGTFDSARVDIDTITFAMVNGKWKPISFIRKLNLEVPASGDHVGDETVSPPEMAASAAEGAQR